MFNLNRKTQVIFIALVFALAIFIFSNVSDTKAAATDNVSGYAWSDDFGWISFNCVSDGTCPASNYGVNLDFSTGDLSGYAWSDNIGWISFNCVSDGTCPASNYGVSLDSFTGELSGYSWSDNIGWISFNSADVAGCPVGDCQPRYDFSSGELLGWARVLAFGDGWDGWISLNCANNGACGAFQEKVYCVAPIPLTCALALDSTSIVVGGSATLAWVTTGATGVNINTVPEAFSDSKIVTPVVTTTYDLVATDGVNSTTCSETLTVTAPLPVCDSFTASPSSIISGNSSTLTWATTDATNVTINDGTGAVNKALDNTTGEVVSPVANTSYILTATNDDGDTATCSTTVLVSSPLPPATPPSAGGGHMILTKFDKDIVEVFKDASLFLLSIIGGIALLVIVLSGILYIFAGANPEAQTKAKKTFNYAVIGLILVLVSYALIKVASDIGT